MRTTKLSSISGQVSSVCERCSDSLPTNKPHVVAVASLGREANSTFPGSDCSQSMATALSLLRRLAAVQPWLSNENIWASLQSDARCWDAGQVCCRPAVPAIYAENFRGFITTQRAQASQVLSSRFLEALWKGWKSKGMAHTTTPQHV